MSCAHVLALALPPQSRFPRVSTRIADSLTLLPPHIALSVLPRPQWRAATAHRFLFESIARLEFIQLGLQHFAAILFHKEVCLVEILQPAGR